MITDKEIELGVLSSIFKSDEPSYTGEETFQKMKSLVEKDFISLLEYARFPDKTRVMKDSENWLGLLHFMLKTSLLKGKTLIGLLHDSDSSRRMFYHACIPASKRIDSLLSSLNIPILHVNSDHENVSIINAYHIREDIARNSLEILVNQLKSKYQMDFHEVITHFISETRLKEEHLAFLDLSLTAPSNDFRDVLLERIDLFVVNIDYQGDWIKPLYALNHIGCKKEILIHVTELKPELISFLKETNLNFKIVDGDLSEELKLHNYLCDHSILLNKSEQLIYEIRAHIHQDRNKNYEIMENINKSLLLLDEENKEGLIDYRSQIQENIEKDTKSLEDFQQLTKKMKDALTELEVELRVENGLTPLHLGYIQYKLGNSYIKLEKYEEAKQIANQLIDIGIEKAHILLLSIDDQQGNTLNKKSLAVLQSMDLQDDDVLEAKIMYRKSLLISENHAINLTMKMKTTENAEILFLIGKHYVSKGSMEGIKYLKDALERGFVKAGEELFRFYKSKNFLSMPNLTYLGKMLNREANFTLGQKYKEAENERNAIIHFSLAAVCGHSVAIFELAEIFYNRKQYQKASGYYKTLLKLKEDPQVQFGRDHHLVVERLGECYFLIKNYLHAYETLINCPTGNAYFMLGQIFEKGLGKIADINAAVQFYEKGNKIGDKRCSTHYLKITIRLVEEKKKKEKQATNTYNSNENYKQSTTFTSTRSGCFLTTATCTVLGKKDDCEEILAFKRFRDEWLIDQSDGPELIKEYYRNAPDLVEAINLKQNSLEIYQNIWNRFIQISYGYILEEKYDEAKETYIQMVLEVMELYLNSK